MKANLVQPLTLFNEMEITFYKYHGTGNDFVVIDNRDLSFPKNAKTINQLCKRHFGIGADGLILLEKNEKGYYMDYYNADGMPSSMCGNGGRCFTAFAKRLGLFDSDFEFYAVDGLHSASINGSKVTLKMQSVETISQLSDTDFVLNTGSPHYIKFVPQAPTNFVADALAIRNSKPYIKEGINVNFVWQYNEQYYIRTFERGVEAETKSCGTGNVAAAIAIINLRRTRTDKITFQTCGGALTVSAKQNEGVFAPVYLIGETKLVFKGSITPAT